jgi:hypothetical protein
MRRSRFLSIFWAAVIVLSLGTCLVIFKGCLPASLGGLKRFGDGLEKGKEFVLTIAAALLADVFSRRAGYRGKIEALYDKSNHAVQAAVRFTKDTTQNQWYDACTALREAIDANRIVFHNQRGSYPFEVLKTIYQLVSEFEPLHPIDPQVLASLRSAVVFLWRKLQDQLKNERPTTIESNEFKEIMQTLLTDDRFKTIRPSVERLCGSNTATQGK